jgi:pimeloyl-ACP methyl ester carboxylesterase
MSNPCLSLSRGSMLAVALGLPLLLGAGSCPQRPNPIIFVHGGSGSGGQFESQAMRFESNGYPADYVRVLEYDSSVPLTTNPANMAVVHAALDDLIAEIQDETGASQVDLMGHSLGTFVSQSYLSTPSRAANVAHYVNIDGATATALPGGVPTLAIWAGTGTPGREITGATNVVVADQTHIQSATSEESFIEMYKFLRGRAPFTSHILPEIRPKVSGRVTAFPQNTGLDGATLAVWVVDGATGERVFDHPLETYAIGPDGDFGPFKAWFGVHYEFEVSRPGEVTINYFYEPFIHTDDLVRLNVALGLAPFIATGPNHVALTVVRFKEFWGDRGAENDVLEINGTDVINPTVFATNSIGAASSAYFAFDTSPVPPPLVGPPDGLTDLNYIPFPFGAPLAFLTASDLYIPTAPPGTVSVHVVPRGKVGEDVTVNVPNLPSTTNRMVVQLNDFEQ